MNFKENLRQIRRIKGLTQEELAEMIGVTKFAIRHYEQGQTEPKFELLEKIKIALECSYDDLLK